MNKNALRFGPPNKVRDDEFGVSLESGKPCRSFGASSGRGRGSYSGFRPASALAGATGLAVELHLFGRRPFLKPSQSISTTPRNSGFRANPFASAANSDFSPHRFIYFLPTAAGLSTLMGLPPAYARI